MVSAAISDDEQRGIDNLAYVRSLSESNLLLHDGTVIPTSRRRAKQAQRDMLAHLSARTKDMT